MSRVNMSMCAKYWYVYLVNTLSILNVNSSLDNSLKIALLLHVAECIIENLLTVVCFVVVNNNNGTNAGLHTEYV